MTLQPLLNDNKNKQVHKSKQIQSEDKRSYTFTIDFYNYKKGEVVQINDIINSMNYTPNGVKYLIDNFILELKETLEITAIQAII